MLKLQIIVDDDFFQLGHQALASWRQSDQLLPFVSGIRQSGYQALFLQALQHNSDRRALAAHFLFKLVLVDLAIRLIGQEVDGVDLHPGQGEAGSNLLRLVDALGRFFDELADRFDFFQVGVPFVSSLTNIRGHNLLDA